MDIGYMLTIILVDKGIDLEYLPLDICSLFVTVHFLNKFVREHFVYLSGLNCFTRER